MSNFNKVSPLLVLSAAMWTGGDPVLFNWVMCLLGSITPMDEHPWITWGRMVAWNQMMATWPEALLNTIVRFRVSVKVHNTGVDYKTGNPYWFGIVKHSDGVFDLGNERFQLVDVVDADLGSDGYINVYLQKGGNYSKFQQYPTINPLAERI